MDMNRVFSLDKLAVEDADRYPNKRFLFNSLRNCKGRPFVALIGPRGCGKTVLLRQLRRETPESVYVSVDTLSKEFGLVKLISTLWDQYKIKTVFLDEVHFHPAYQKDLKELYDFYPVNVFFTSSSALSMDSAAWDLSRRVIIHKVLPFSFREYLYFKDGILLEPLPFEKIIHFPVPAEYLRTRYRFEDYLAGGLFPFTLEAGTGIGVFQNILSKIVRSDIPVVAPTLTIKELDDIEKCLQFIGRSPLDGVNYTSLSRNTGITKYKAEQFVDLLEKSFVLRRGYPEGTNVLKEPKIFMTPPYRLLFRPLEECVGEMREDFFALAMEQYGIPFRYLKTNRGMKTPDFYIEIEGVPFVLEVGGKRKGFSQFKGVEYRRKIVLYHEAPGDRTPSESSPDRYSASRVPLFCLGFA